MYHSFTYFSHITTKLMNINNCFIIKSFISNNKIIPKVISIQYTKIDLKEKSFKLRIYEAVLMLKHDVTVNPSLESLISILVDCNKQIKMVLLNSFLIEFNLFLFLKK